MTCGIKSPTIVDARWSFLTSHARTHQICCRKLYSYCPTVHPINSAPTSTNCKSSALPISDFLVYPMAISKSKHQPACKSARVMMSIEFDRTVTRKEKEGGRRGREEKRKHSREKNN